MKTKVTKKNIILFLCLVLVCALLIPKQIINEDFKEHFNEHYNNDIMIWSKGPFINNYSNKDTDICSNKKDIIDIINHSTNIIWIRNGSTSNTLDLQLFANNIDLLHKPVVLVTTDGDRSVPSSYNKDIVDKILNNKNITFWYTQNYDRSMIHPKLKHYPIGFDFHTKEWLINNNINKKQAFMIQTRKQNPTHARISNKIFSDTHFVISHNERTILYNTLKKNKDIVFSDKLKSFEEITKEYNKYNFVLSPRGNGLDCHRTWELFLAGNIVITKTSPLDDMYVHNKLPVVIIKDWNELNIDLINKLKKWYIQYHKYTLFEHIYPKLQLKYWLKIN